jgi:hypothetical protein
MSTTCGTCYYHRRGRCKNKKASTYNSYYDADSYGCPMHKSHLIKPFGYGINGLAAIILIPIQIVLMIVGGSSSSTSNSGDGGFSI